MKRYRLLFLTFLLVVTSVKFGFSQLTIGAEIRPRSEFRNGFKTPKSEGDVPSYFTEQRSRLTFNLKKETYEVKLAFQDVRVWGETSQIFKKEIGSTFLSEAWGEVPLNDKASLKVGRQIISYDNQRIFGGLEWAQQGRRHDAAILKFENKEQKQKLHFGIALNADQDIAEPANLQNIGANYYSVSGNYKSLFYGWYHKDFENLKLSILASDAGTQQSDSTVSHKQTFGFVASQSFEKFEIGTENYYQTGTIGTNSVGALLAGAFIKFKIKARPITLGVEYIQGQDQGINSSKITAFSPDYGTNHAFNGLMDYFYVGPQNGNVGVTDIYLKTKFKMAGGVLNTHFHEFFTGSSQILDTDLSQLDSRLGTELDLFYTKNLVEDVNLSLGFSQMFATDSFLTLRNKDKKSNNWAWVMLTFSPKIFTSK